MTVINRVAPGLTVLVLCIAMLGFVGVASGQEMTEQQRLERCQNNLNLLATLQQQVEALPPDGYWSVWKISAVESWLTVIEATSRADEPEASEWMTPRTGFDDVDADIEKTYNKCLRDEKLDIFVTEGSRRKCLDAVAAGLRRAIADAKAFRSQYDNQMTDNRRQIENCQTNLTALRCDEPGGVVPNLTATWKVTQGNYTGWLFLHQTGVYLTGSLMWQNHEPGSIVSGTVGKGSIRFIIQYATGGGGSYDGTIDPSGKSMKGSTSGTLGSDPWTMTWAAEASR